MPQRPLRLRRRTLSASLVLAAALLALLAAVTWLDPGSKNDRTTSLVTPTLAARSARVFAVAADESRVDFTASVRGMTLAGVFPVERGTITLEPVGEALRVLVALEIDVDSVETANPAISQVLRAAMASGDYPIAFYAATSRGLVPVTEEEIAFALDGELDVHNVAHPHAMDVRAQLVGGDMWAVATSPLDLANHGVAFPAIFGDTTIQLTAHLQAHEQAGE
ncbi:MAG: YceI family protein [Anaerolineae bacterium]|nr:YceI family protein [Anaerolineae bacterium]